MRTRTQIENKLKETEEKYSSRHIIESARDEATLEVLLDIRELLRLQKALSKLIYQALPPKNGGR